MKHHEDSIKNMIAYFQENPEIIALFLTGSVATGTERPNSDLDGVAVVSQEYYEQKKKGISFIPFWQPTEIFHKSKKTRCDYDKQSKEWFNSIRILLHCGSFFRLQFYEIANING